ncbi:hypothetical protein RUM43_005284 [Polyplax serrata]|uniref:Uncharacterized protein n=1 Tax=Polyplax serrata TaxID=468196 RepID=A0AAN8NQW7_POLSC
MNLSGARLLLNNVKEGAGNFVGVIVKMSARETRGCAFVNPSPLLRKSLETLIKHRGQSNEILPLYKGHHCPVIEQRSNIFAPEDNMTRNDTKRKKIKMKNKKSQEHKNLVYSTTD